MPYTIKNPFIRLDSQHRLYIALAITVLSLIFTWNKVTIPSMIMINWSVCALCIIIMNWTIILSTDPREMRKIASLKDSSRLIILLFVITASCVSLFSIIFLLQSNAKDGAHHADQLKHILMSIGSVAISWWMLHTVFTMTYAHMYYTYTPREDDPPETVKGGLEFPEEGTPDFLDFVYFSFVIGMTFQVSDVEISSRPIRRLALLHAIISFAFNTAIVALSINVISGLM